MLKTLWNSYKIPIIIGGVILILSWVVAYQWGYINGEKSKS